MIRGTIDIESFPGTYRAWGDNMYETSLIKEVTPVKLASFSYKRWGRHKPYTRGLWEFPSEKEFVEDLWRIFNENDVLIGHNAKKFDLRQSNTFFAMHDLPATRTEIEDTLSIVRKRFKLPSYKLKYCLVFFGIGVKLETGGDALWFGVEEGDSKARKHFLKYNENDTVQTEALYEYLERKGWTKKNVKSQFSYEHGCPRCKAPQKWWQSRGERGYSDGIHEYYYCTRCGKYGALDRLLRPWTELLS